MLSEKIKSQSKWVVTGLAAIILVAILTAFFFGTQLEAVELETKSTIRVACVGDSITSDNDYPDKLGTMLGGNYTVENFGVGGSTVSLQFRKPYLNQSACQEAKNLAPDIVVIMLGTNDAYLGQEQRSNFINDYQKLIVSFQALSSEPKIFIVVPPPVFDNTMKLNATVVEVNVIPLVKQTANNLGLPLIDMYTPFVNHPEYFLDGVHPNSQGAKIVAAQIFDAIMRV